MAQSTLFNIPSTDAVSKGKGYFEFDWFAQMPTTSGTPRLYTYAPRIIAGLGKGVEVGTNFVMFHSSSTQSYIQPNLKWRFFGNDDKGLAASGGAMLISPMNNRSSVDSFGMVYGNFSKKVKSGDYGPRFTFGGYGLVDTDGLAPDEGGAILGYEQPVHPKVTLLADWFSGKNFFGYFTPGVSFTLPHASLLNVGYSIGNDSYSSPKNNNRALFIYYGITFP
jgi:hypothetical protein